MIERTRQRAEAEGLRDVMVAGLLAFLQALWCRNSICTVHMHCGKADDTCLDRKP